MTFGRKPYDPKTSLKPIRFAGKNHPLPQILEALANRRRFAVCHCEAPVQNRRIYMRTTSKVSLFALSLTLCLALAIMTFGTTFGQAVYGSIFGTVTDASGAAVPNATVTITNSGKYMRQTTKTTYTVNYTQPRIIPCNFPCKVEHTNSKSAVIETVVITFDTASTANISLQPGQVSEEITITAEAPLLKTDRADVATTFETRQ